MRRILHHGPDPSDTPTEISERVISGCWFEWHRQGGCGRGEIRLRDEFADRAGISPNDWISIESEPGLRWYLGRVETREATYPSGIRLRLEGMGVELGEVFPGGFGSDADGRLPHRLGATDLFSLDPDRDIESFDAAADASGVVRTLMARCVEPATHISYLPLRVEDALRAAGVESLKVRGEETARSLIKELAVRAGGAAWGVDAAGEFFFLQRRTDVELTLQIGVNVTQLEELSDRELLFNRLLLTGDYIYDRAEASDNIAVRSFRWRGNYVEPASRAVHGERRLRIWIPWIRTQADAISFSREFFRTYSRPQPRYRITSGAMTAPMLPWLGAIRLRNAAGFVIATGLCDAIRVRFDRVPRFELEIGPEDPRNLWPEPMQDERWELPARPQIRGGEVSVTSLGDPWSSGGGGGTSTDGPFTSTTTDTEIETSFSDAESSSSADSDASDDSSDLDGSSTEAGSSDLTSAPSSDATSDPSFDESSDDSSDASSGADSSADESEPDSSDLTSDDGDSDNDSSGELSSGLTSDSSSDSSGDSAS